MGLMHKDELRRTKIVCTVGPASWSEPVLEQLIANGMDVARLNFSHGTYEEKLRVIERVKDIRNREGRSIGILQDLSGPKIRVGELPASGLLLEIGTEVYIYPASADGPGRSDRPAIPVGYDALLDDVSAGSRILMDDGRIEVEVIRSTGEALVAEVIHGGDLSSGKGVNFPGQTISERAPTKKDLEDLRFGIEHGVDFVALSFVQDADDVLRAREAVREMNGDVGIIAKLERESAVRELDAILDVSDGVMVARGDLGIETSLVRVPILQKLIVQRANRKNTLVITATQMLGSMIESPTPTRAEVSDVANAIYDGTDAVMLSGESAIGRYPVESVKMMRRIAEATDLELSSRDTFGGRDDGPETDADAMVLAQAVCGTAAGAEARLIAAHTLSGRTARLISKYRPKVPIAAITPRQSTFQRMSLVWGVEPILHGSEEKHMDFVRAVRSTEEFLRTQGLIQEGDAVVYSGGVSGEKGGMGGGTNVMTIQRVGGGS